MSPQKIAYVDECGIDAYLYREYGYAPRSQKVFGRVSGRKYKRCGIVAAKMTDKILAPFQYSGTMDSGLFEFWFVNQLLPSLDKGAVIVMDNTSFHSKKRLLCAAQNAGCRLVCPLIPQSSTQLKISGPGLNSPYAKPFHLILVLMTLSVPLFNCGDYIRNIWQGRTVCCILVQGST